jgi:hypothetical protein
MQAGTVVPTVGNKLDDRRFLLASATRKLMNLGNPNKSGSNSRSNQLEGQNMEQLYSWSQPARLINICWGIAR